MNINIKRWYYKKIISVKYEEASMYEIVEFLYESSKQGFNLVNWLVDFIETYGNKKLNKIDRMVLAIKFNDIFFTIKTTHFGGAFDEQNGDGKGTADEDFSSYVAFLSKELNQDPLHIMKNYSVNQLKYITDGIIWNANEMTEEGKKKNKLKKLGKSAKVNSDAVKNLLQKLDEQKCNEALKSK